MISCKEYVEQEKKRLKELINRGGFSPSLAIIQTNDDPASIAYIKGKVKDAEELGIMVCVCDKTGDFDGDFYKFLSDIYIPYLSYSGVIIQKPLSDCYKPYEKQIDNFIDLAKDVDGLREKSSFTPATARGIMDWLEFNKIDLTGKNVVIIGRSKLVSKPLAKLMTDADATVTMCHSKTKCLSQHTRNADIIISAIGKPKYLDSWYFNEHKQQIVIDVGITREGNRLMGDVDPSVKNVVGYLTPVPGGVGLLTRLALMKNVIEAEQMRRTN